MKIDISFNDRSNFTFSMLKPGQAYMLSPTYNPDNPCLWMKTQGVGASNTVRLDNGNKYTESDKQGVIPVDITLKGSL